MQAKFSVRLRRKRTLYPFKFCFVQCVEQHAVEATVAFTVRLQPMLCGENQALLLVIRNAGGRTAKVGVAAKTDFDENDGFSILGDQIDFTATYAKVARDNFQTVRL